MFVDTGAWYAAYVASDPNHAVVKDLIDDAKTRLVTTDLVLAESLTLLRARNEYQRAILLGKDLLAETIAELVFLTPSDYSASFAVFSKFADKKWSFVDCSSYAIMQRFGIKDAVSLDSDFRQMPGITVHP